jgi:hypothetical protein
MGKSASGLANMSRRQRDMAMGIKKVVDDSIYSSGWYKDEVAKAERGNREHIAKFDRSFLGVMAKAEADGVKGSPRAPLKLGGNDGGNAGDHHASKVADLLVEAESYPDRASALQHLLHSPRGQALLTRMHKADQTVKESPMSSLQDIAKTHGVAGVVQIAKNITEEQRSFRITEAEFVNLIDTAARVAHPELGALAFEKVYERNPVLARAIAVIKAWPSPMSLTPTMVGGTDSMLQVFDANPDARQQLTEMAESQRRAGESAAQAFERVYLDPANRHLAEAERGQNRPQPTTIFPLPR